MPHGKGSSVGTVCRSQWLCCSGVCAWLYLGSWIWKFYVFLPFHRGLFLMAFLWERASVLCRPVGWLPTNRGCQELIVLDYGPSITQHDLTPWLLVGMGTGRKIKQRQN